MFTTGKPDPTKVYLAPPDDLPSDNDHPPPADPPATLPSPTPSPVPAEPTAATAPADASVVLTMSFTVNKVEAGPSEAGNEGTHDEPTATPDEPTATPDEPTATPDEPTITPDVPAATPDEPNPAATPTAAEIPANDATPDEPTATPDEPTATPDEPTITPDEPTATPDEPNPVATLIPTAASIPTHDASDRASPTPTSPPQRTLHRRGHGLPPHTPSLVHPPATALSPLATVGLKNARSFARFNSFEDIIVIDDSDLTTPTGTKTAAAIATWRLPNSKLRAYWETLLFILAALNAFIVPFRIVFSQREGYVEDPMIKGFGTIIAFTFAADFYVRARKFCHEEGEWG